MSVELNRFQIRAKRDYQAARRHAAYHRALSGDSSEEAGQAALFLAQSLGYCRLWGVDLADQNGSVPKSLLGIICETLSRRIDEIIHGLTSFEQRMETASTPEEEELFASSVLRQRMDGWACWIAIDERAQMLIADGSEDAGDYLPKLGKLATDFDQWDIDLQARADLLATVCDTYLLENWSNYLVPPFSDAPPWWLDNAFWQRNQMLPVPNCISFSTPITVSSNSKVELENEAAAGIWFETPWNLTEPLAMAGANADDQSRRVEFTSRSNKPDAAIAYVNIPTRLSGQGTITIDIRFSFVVRDPTAVRLGSAVSIGAAATGVVICEYRDGEPPLYRTSITLSRDDIERLELQRYVRLSVDGRDWIAQGTGK
jgi:hypothetical protein